MRWKRRSAFAKSTVERLSCVRQDPRGRRRCCGKRSLEAPTAGCTSKTTGSHVRCLYPASSRNCLGLRAVSHRSHNGSGYRSRIVAALCRALDVAQRWTRPYRPQTNGKAERFIQTLLREWAYGRPYSSSLERQAALPRYLHYYNWHRPHGSLQSRPPISRVIPADNLLSAHS